LEDSKNIGGKVMMKKIRIAIYTIIPLVILLSCVLGFLVAPNDPNQTNLLERYAVSSQRFPFGTDAMGRCVFSRILYGGKTTLGIVLLGSIIIFLVGTVLGMGFSKGIMKSNIIIDSFINAITAIPPVAYLIVFIGAWGNGIRTMLIAMTVSYILRYIKLVRAWTDIEINKAYIMCAVASGATKLRIMMVHVLPNILGQMIQFLCLSCANMVLTITGFSFIGLGLGDNVVDWGSMILEARTVVDIHPYLIFYPMLLVLICAMSFNVLGKQISAK
jgi:peptide/nickel transport system permease protein